MHVVKIAKIIGGIAAFLAAIFGIIQFFRDVPGRTPKLEAAITNIEHVSARTTIPNLKITLAFKDQPVAELWLCRVRLQNVGGVTLLTTGPKPNTNNPIQLKVPQNYEILLVEPKGIDPKDSGFEAQIKQSHDTNGVLDKQQFEVNFEQWRKGESIEAVLYLSSSDEKIGPPRLMPKGRPILDGDIVPLDLSSVMSVQSQAIPFLEKTVGSSWGLVIRLYAIIMLTITGIWITAKDMDSAIAWRQKHPAFQRFFELALFLAIYAALAAMMR